MVSKGPEMVQVPNVQGKQVAEARKILEDAGFKVKVENFMGGIFGTVRTRVLPATRRHPRAAKSPGRRLTRPRRSHLRDDRNAHA